MVYLPPELLQCICKELDFATLKSFRFVSKICALLGAEYLLQRVYLFSTTKSIDLIQKINKHPNIRKSLKTLLIDSHWWAEDRTDPDMYDDDELDDWDIDGYSGFPSDYPYDTGKLTTNTKAHEFFVTSALSGCSSLDQAIILPRSPRKAKSLKIAEGARYCRGVEEFGFLRMGDVSSTLRSVLRVAAAGRLPLLYRIHVVEFNLRLDDKFLTLNNLQAFKNITSFAVSLCDWHNKSHVPPENPRHIFSLSDALVQAERLEVLKIHGCRDDDYRWDRYKNVMHCLLQRARWTFLRDVFIYDLITNEEELVGFLLRHSQSLRRLCLGCTWLEEGSCHSTLTRIAGKFPSLTSIQLQNMFASFKDCVQEDSKSEFPSQTFVLYGSDEVAEHTAIIEGYVRTGTLPDGHSIIRTRAQRQQDRNDNTNGRRSSQLEEVDAEDFEPYHFYRW